MTSRIQEAIGQSVDAAGGPAVVGPLLWPEKDRKSAALLMKACLNLNRRERVSPTQMLQIFKLARARGCTVGIDCLLTEIGCEKSHFLTPEKELEDLQRAYIQNVQEQSALADRIEIATERMCTGDRAAVIATLRATVPQLQALLSSVDGAPA
jgi:hypothetical protein